MKIIYFHLLICFSLFGFSQAKDLETIYNEGIAAYKSEDFELFLTSMQKAEELSPNHPTITYNLAAAYAKNGHTERAKELAQKAILMNTGFKPEEDSDFEGIDFSQLIALKNLLDEEVAKGTLAFTNSEIDLHPESVAYDPKSKDFFLNSVRKGKIIRYVQKTQDFSDFSTGHWAVMGMKVHKDVLWACEVATNEFEGFKEEDKGKSALLKLDLKSGELLGRYELTGDHWFGDVLISKEGEIYVSDSRKPIVYQLVIDSLKIFRDFSKKLFNLQGIALSKSGSKMYLADYKLGIHVYDLESEQLSLVDSPANMITKGVDGLYFYESSLIAIQNGVKPNRVSQFMMDEDGTKILSIKYLDKARDELNEPTLGVLVKDVLYYVANSPWAAYNDGQFVFENLGNNMVLKVLLE